MLVLTFVINATAVAMAATGGGGYRAIPTDPPDSKPHGGYSATTNRCSICHAVHKTGQVGNPAAREAETNSYKLLRIAKDETPGVVAACSFCHDGEGISIKQVYDFSGNPGLTAEHRIGAILIPDASDQNKLDKGNVDELDCLDCHSGAPHSTNANARMLVAAGTNATCKYCHDKNNINAGELGQDAFDKSSHPLVPVGSERIGRETQVAWINVSTCISCHDDLGGTDFPHSTIGGARFLGKEKGGTFIEANKLDSKCYICHRDFFDTLGIGITF